MNISEQTVREHYGELFGIGGDWEVERVEIEHGAGGIVVWVKWNRGKEMKCAKCGEVCPGYDLQRERRWRHLDACGYRMEIRARVPRCECREHGVIGLEVSWASAGSRFSLAFEGHAIEVLLGARSVRDACRLLRIDWDAAAGIRQRAVERGLARRESEEIVYLGLDEKSFGKGHHYGTVLSDLERKRVLEVVEHREVASARKALESLPEGTRKGIAAVAMDMWKPFQNATMEVLPQAEIVHDKFHVMRYLYDAVDKVRRQEHRELKAEGDDRLSKTKYLWLMNPENFSDEQQESFDALFEEKLKAGRAWTIKEVFKHIWSYQKAGNARRFFRQWYGRTKRSKLPPMMQVADTLKRHLENILTYFRHRITNAAAEGLNSVIQALKANARGFRTFSNYRIAILFHLGRLDLKPPATHSVS